MTSASAFIFIERMDKYMPIDTEIEMTVEEQKAHARAEKDRLMRMIVTYQRGNQYNIESLAGKTLKQLQSIYDKVVHS